MESASEGRERENQQEQEGGSVEASALLESVADIIKVGAGAGAGLDAPPMPASAELLAAAASRWRLEDEAGYWSSSSPQHSPRLACAAAFDRPHLLCCRRAWTA